MRLTFWGTRGSIAVAGPDTAKYGGNTSCVEVRGAGGEVVVLDAGTGVRRCGARLPKSVRRVDILLTHLHMDHLQGLGFFGPLFNPEVEAHLWGPASTVWPLKTRLMRYLSPPLFPVMLRDLPCKLVLHEVPCDSFQIGGLTVTTARVCHPGPTVGYRVSEGARSIAYIPDHEPALGVAKFPLTPEWTSGYDLAAGVDVLIHDGQFTESEYPNHVGWGHSALSHTLAFAKLAQVKRLVPFHYDPARDDDAVTRMVDAAVAAARPTFPVTPAIEGESFEV